MYSFLYHNVLFIVKVEFTGVRGIGYLGDIAIDDIQLIRSTCPGQQLS